jgi:hypothetical protein
MNEADLTPAERAAYYSPVTQHAMRAFKRSCLRVRERIANLEVALQEMAQAHIVALEAVQRAVPSLAPVPCVLCGNPPVGMAEVPEGPLCHSADRDCYHRWTVWNERPDSEWRAKRPVGAERDAPQ